MVIVGRVHLGWEELAAYRATGGWDNGNGEVFVDDAIELW